MANTCTHREGPKGYVEGLEWLERMSKRYDQFKCGKCGLYKVWKRKGATPNSRSTKDE